MFIFISVGFVSACENQSEIINLSIDNQEYNVDENLLSLNNEPVGNTFHDLQKYIDSASSGSTINLTHNYSYADGDSSIIINKTLTINGNGVSLDALKNVRILQVNADSVVLKNIKFINGFNNEGAGIYWNGNTGLIENCTLFNNTASNGGAIYVNSGSLNIQNNVAIFNNNANSNGGAVYVYNAIITIQNNVQISNNTASNNGGAVYVGSGTTYIQKNVKISNNSAINGGGLYLDDNFRNTQIYIQNDVEIFSNSAINGGGIYFVKRSLYIQNNVKIYKNHANTGGGLYIVDFDSYIVDVDFFENTATYDGGGIYSSSSAFIRKLSNSRIYSNQANNGAGLYAGGMLNLNNTFIYNNAAVNNGGGLYLGIPSFGNSLILTFSSFENNSASNASAIYNAAHNSVVDKCIFINNSANDTASVYWAGSGGVINNSQFIDSKIKSQVSKSSYASAVYWCGVNGCLLNSNITNSVADASNIVYAIYSNNNTFFVDNIRVMNTKSGGGDNYSLFIQDVGFDNFGENVEIENIIFTPVINIEGTGDKSQYIINVGNVKGGRIAYSIDGGSGSIVSLNDSNQVLINSSVLVSGWHNITIRYLSDLSYVDNAVETIPDFLLFDVGLNITNISSSDNKYTYDFVCNVDMDDVNVRYYLALMDGSVEIVENITNNIISCTVNSPLVNLTAVISDYEITLDYYPLKALQFIINKASSGSTIVLYHDYIWSSDIDTCGDGHFSLILIIKILMVMVIVLVDYLLLL